MRGVTDIERVGVVGCGQMGAGIAEVCARAGLDVRVAETTGEALEFGRTRLANSLGRATGRGKITEAERDAALERITFTTDLGELADRDVVIEAVVESEPVKIEIFQVLDQVVTRPDAILASNTSAIPLVNLAVATSRPSQVLGVHFFNPAQVQRLVELVPALTTSENTVERVELLVTQVLGKEAIRAQDRSGFVVNALLVPYLLAAIRMFESGAASRDDIDNGMELGCAHPRPAEAGRPDRPRHGRVDRRLDVRGAQGAAVRPAAPATAHGRRRPPRPEDGHRVLSVRPRRLKGCPAIQRRCPAAPPSRTA